MTAERDAGVSYDVLGVDEMTAAVPALGEILADAVNHGSSVNFVLPFTPADGRTWWASQLPDVASGTIRPIVARVDGRLEGVTLLILSRKPNSPHRAEVSKVLVHSRARRRGVGTGLMAAVEEVARSEGRWLLLLDTVRGSDADRLYRRLGWVEFGVVPDHSVTPDGVLAPTTFYYKDLRPKR